MYKQILRKIIYAIEDRHQTYDLEALFIGNSCSDYLHHFFEYTEHIESYPQESELGLKSADTLIIAGPVNKNQVLQLQEAYNSLRGEKKFVVYLPGPFKDDLLNRSYFAEKNIHNVVPVDLEYKKFPFHFADFVQQLKQLKREALV